ncbi:hypothetical protein BJX99DRAFT_258220 [Aspergillus californicus]
MFRELRVRISRGSRGSDPAPSAPAMTAETPPPRAIHTSDDKRSPTEIPHQPYSVRQMEIIVVNAKGAADYSRIDDEYNYLDPTCTLGTDYLCDGYIYHVYFGGLHSASYKALCDQMQNICLMFTYNDSSRDSWDETVATCERLHRCFQNAVIPFLPTMIAMGEGEGETTVPQEEAEAFAKQHDYLFVKFTPRTGRGVRDAVALLVETVHGAPDQYTMDEKGSDKRRKRTAALQALFPGEEPLVQNQTLTSARRRILPSWFRT